MLRNVYGFLCSLHKLRSFYQNVFENLLINDQKTISVYSYLKVLKGILTLCLHKMYVTGRREHFPSQKVCKYMINVILHSFVCLNT